MVLPRPQRGQPLISSPGQRLPGTARVSNLSTRPFPAEASFGRRLVRLGAQLYESGGAVTDRDHASAPLPRSLGPGASLDEPMPVAPGRYALTFDLVSEGIDWFEACGSETTTTLFWVVA